jgi:hypothetical protein
MVRLAEEAEQTERVGCTYSVGDVTRLAPTALGQFDVVMGVYLLNYARSDDELRGMARSIAARLAPGGRFVGINDNPRNGEGRYGPLPGCGFSRALELPRHEGSRIHYVMETPDGDSFEFDNYWLSPATYARVFGEEGLRLTWVDCIGRTGPDGAIADLWRAFLVDCPITGIEARV